MTNRRFVLLSVLLTLICRPLGPPVSGAAVADRQGRRVRRPSLRSTTEAIPIFRNVSPVHGALYGRAQFGIGRPVRHPGPSTAGQGNPAGGLLVRFGVREADPEAALRLKLDFVEVHSGSAPRLEIALNDFRTEVQTPQVPIRTISIRAKPRRKVFAPRSKFRPGRSARATTSSRSVRFRAAGWCSTP